MLGHCLASFVYLTRKTYLLYSLGSFLGGAVVKNPPANAGDTRDMDLIPGSGRSPGGRNGNPIQYTCLENPMDRGGWWGAVHGVAESGTTEHDHTHTNSWVKAKDAAKYPKTENSPYTK